VVKVEMSRAERIEKELEEMRKNNRNFLPENENDNTEDDIALKGSFNSFLVERGRTLSVKKIVSFNNMSRGERIEKELEEMRENIRNSLPEDENESNEKDFPTNYSSNSFQVDENDINDQPNLNWPLPHTPPPRIPPPQLDLDLQLSNEGVKLAERGRHIEALACFDKAIAINPDSCDVWSNRGACLTRMGRFREAQIAFAKASQLLEKYGRRRF
jgi:tetratricopeptide (TPR) repeat protein